MTEITTDRSTSGPELHSTTDSIIGAAVERAKESLAGSNPDDTGQQAGSTTPLSAESGSTPHGPLAAQSAAEGKISDAPVAAGQTPPIPDLSLSDLSKQIVEKHKEQIPEIQEYLNAIYRAQQSDYDKLKNKVQETVKLTEGVSPDDLKFLNYLAAVHQQYGPSVAARVLREQANQWDPTPTHPSDTLPPTPSLQEEPTEWASEGEERLAKENAALKKQLEEIVQWKNSFEQQRQEETQLERDRRELAEVEKEFGRALTPSEQQALVNHMKQEQIYSIRAAARDFFFNDLYTRGLQTGQALAAQKAQSPPPPVGVGVRASSGAPSLDPRSKNFIDQACEVAKAALATR